VYNRTTKISDNYWAPYGGLNGRKAKERFLDPNTPLNEKVTIYTKSLVRPGIPELDKRKLFAH